MIVSVQAESFN